MDKYFEVNNLGTKVAVIHRVTGEVGFAELKDNDSESAIFEAIHNIMMKYYDWATNDATKP